MSIALLLIAYNRTPVLTKLLRVKPEMNHRVEKWKVYSNLIN